jgi:glucose-1-phosphate cytidylyltransferase
MKVIILAGGFGTRLSEYTDSIPKPMVPINGKPILCHIMEIYAKYGHTDFYVALGYKGEVIKNFFKNFKTTWNVNLIETGSDTMTGGRVRRLKEYIGNETFMLTYGDGLSNININKLIEFHQNHKKMVTISAVRPPARFGAIRMDGDKVKTFREKAQLEESWINGGFLVLQPEFFDFIDNDTTVLERDPLDKALELNQMMGFKHEGFWQCMDHKMDKDILEDLCKKDMAPWLK